jgi:hypothetical protein
MARKVAAPPQPAQLSIEQVRGDQPPLSGPGGMLV